MVASVPLRDASMPLRIFRRYIAHRFPVDVPLIGDSKATLRALIPKLQYKKDRSWRQTIEKEVREWDAIEADRAMQSGDGQLVRDQIWT